MTPMKEQVGRLLEQLRGPVTKTALAERLQVSRQTVLKLEAGAMSLDRLDQLAEAYGVEFVIVAVDPAGPKWGPPATPSPAPGLRELVPPTPAPAG